MMHALGVLAGMVLIAVILIDAFETIIQPRRVTRRIRLTRLFLFVTWAFWSGASKRLTGWEARSPACAQASVHIPLQTIWSSRNDPVASRYRWAFVLTTYFLVRSALVSITIAPPSSPTRPLNCVISA